MCLGNAAGITVSTQIGLATDVIRAAKAWSKFGLPHALQQQDNSSSSAQLGQPPFISAAATAAVCQAALPAWVAPTSAGGYDYTKQPPGYIWEVLMVLVLQHKLAAAKIEGRSATEQYPSGTRTLQLFMDVLQAASQLLLPDSTEVIPLYELYTPEQCELLRELWGPVGPLCTPYIISPIDPSYNCTKHGLFKGWGAVAHAAGELYEQMPRLLHSDGAAMAAAAGGQPISSGGADDGEVQYMNAWEQLLSSSSLGPGVQAFDASSADHPMGEEM